MNMIISRCTYNEGYCPPKACTAHRFSLCTRVCLAARTSKDQPSLRKKTNTHGAAWCGHHITAHAWKHAQNSDKRDTCNSTQRLLPLLLVSAACLPQIPTKHRGTTIPCQTCPHTLATPPAWQPPPQASSLCFTPACTHSAYDMCLTAVPPVTGWSLKGVAPEFAIRPGAAAAAAVQVWARAAAAAITPQRPEGSSAGCSSRAQATLATSFGSAGSAGTAAAGLSAMAGLGR